MHTQVGPHLIPHIYYLQFDSTPLLIAAKNGLATIAKILLEAGADKNAKKDQKTALHLAVANISTVQVLLDAGADVNATDRVSTY